MLQNDEETQENIVKEKPVREGNRVKRSYRNAKVHNLSERVRKNLKIWIKKEKKKYLYFCMQFNSM